jgi:hypothetical protein
MTQPLPPPTTPFAPGERLDELPGYLEANRAFHRRIVVGSDNPVRLRVRDQLALRVDRARPPGSASAMREHVRNGLSAVLGSLERAAATDAATPPSPQAAASDA